MENTELSEDELDEIEAVELEKEKQLWREFWTFKNGGIYPERMDKTKGGTTTFEEDNKERAKLDKEFEDFVKNKKTAV